MERSGRFEVKEKTNVWICKLLEDNGFKAQIDWRSPFEGEIRGLDHEGDAILHFNFDYGHTALVANIFAYGKLKARNIKRYDDRSSRDRFSHDVRAIIVNHRRPSQQPDINQLRMVIEDLIARAPQDAAGIIAWAITDTTERHAVEEIAGKIIVRMP